MLGGYDLFVHQPTNLVVNMCVDSSWNRAIVQLKLQPDLLLRFAQPLLNIRPIETLHDLPDTQ